MDGIFTPSLLRSFLRFMVDFIVNPLTNAYKAFVIIAKFKLFEVQLKGFFDLVIRRQC